MPNNVTSEKNDRATVEPPLWSIGIAAAVILLAPMMLYSIAPAGPIREGDTIFSNGAHKVHLSEPEHYNRVGYEDTCLLDPQDPLIVLHRSPGSADDSMIVQVQGRNRLEWPFCPPQAEILVKPHQVLQKPNLFQDIRDSVVRIFRG